MAFSARLNGFCVASLLAMCSAAVRGPLAVGANATVNVVVPVGPLTVVAGGVVSENIDASAPSMVTATPVRSNPPVLATVNVRLADPPTAALPTLAVPPGVSAVPAGCCTTMCAAALAIAAVIVCGAEMLLNV